MITKKLVTGAITVLEDGQLQLREDTIILDDDKEITRLFHRRVLEPGNDVSNEDKKIKAISQIVWTPEVIDEFKRKKSETILLDGVIK